MSTMWTNSRRKWCCLLFLSVVSLPTYSYFILQAFSSLRRAPPSFTGNTTILLWHWPFGKPCNLSGDVCLEHWGIHGCLLVDNRSLFSRANLVVFHNHELMSGRQKLPLKCIRPSGQRWVWLSLESPENNGKSWVQRKHFDYIMTYRRDADITIPYGQLVSKEAENDGTVGAFIPKGKTSLACWVVSNYSKHHKRTAVYEKLKKVIPVEVYGRAVNKYLDAHNLLPTISRCYFYLAFENSISTDYITEKFWYNALVGGAVPVVLGPPREQYEAVAPKDSFIHVDDFRSIEELGNFLKKLAEDKERYAKYFAWKQQHTVKLYRDWRERLCAICAKLRKPNT